MGRARVVLLLALVSLAASPVARADGDPASDYLLSRSTFIPPDDGIPTAYANQLIAAVRDAKVRGYTIRVAVIGSRYDLGSVTILDKKPKQYAQFLGTELRLLYHGRLLIVMPNGLAVSRNGRPAPSEQAVVDRIPAPGAQGQALVSAATNAVLKLAGAAGVLVPKPPLAASGRTHPASTATRDRIVIALAAGIAGLLVAVYVLYRRRGRDE